VRTTTAIQDSSITSSLLQKIRFTANTCFAANFTVEKMIKKGTALPSLQTEDKVIFQGGFVFLCLKAMRSVFGAVFVSYNFCDSHLQQKASATRKTQALPLRCIL